MTSRIRKAPALRFGGGRRFWVDGGSVGVDILFRDEPADFENILDRVVFDKCSQFVVYLHDLCKDLWFTALINIEPH